MRRWLDRLVLTLCACAATCKVAYVSFSSQTGVCRARGDPAYGGVGGHGEQLARAAGGRGGEPGSGDVTCASSLDEVLASGGGGGDGGPPPASLGTLRRAGVDGSSGLPAEQTLVFDSTGPRCIAIRDAFGSVHGGIGVNGSLSPAGTAGGSGGASNQAGGAGQPGYALIVW